MSNRNGETWGNIEKVLFVFRQIVERDLRKNPSCVCVCEYFRVHGQYNHQLLTTRVRLIRDPQKHTMVTILTQSEEAFQDQWDMAGKHKKKYRTTFFSDSKTKLNFAGGRLKNKSPKIRRSRRKDLGAYGDLTRKRKCSGPRCVSIWLYEKEHASYFSFFATAFFVRFCKWLSALSRERILQKSENNNQISKCSTYYKLETQNVKCSNLLQNVQKNFQLSIAQNSSNDFENEDEVSRWRFSLLLVGLH